MSRLQDAIGYAAPAKAMEAMEQNLFRFFDNPDSLCLAPFDLEGVTPQFDDVERIVRARLIPCQITATPLLKQDELQPLRIGAYGGMYTAPHAGKIATTDITFELTYALPISADIERTDNVDYAITWRGDEIIGISPNSDFYPFYPDNPWGGDR